MKTTTVKGTKVEITGTSGCNLVTVNVAGRDTTTQVNAEDLVRPGGDLPVELSELKFHDPSKDAEPAEPAGPIIVEPIDEAK